MSRVWKKVDRERRIGATADYLLGKPLREIAKKWGVADNQPPYWARLAGFKLRKNPHNPRKNHHLSIIKRGYSGL